MVCSATASLPNTFAEDATGTDVRAGQFRAIRVHKGGRHCWNLLVGHLSIICPNAGKRCRIEYPVRIEPIIDPVISRLDGTAGSINGSKNLYTAHGEGARASLPSNMPHV